MLLQSSKEFAQSILRREQSYAPRLCMSHSIVQRVRTSACSNHCVLRRTILVEVARTKSSRADNQRRLDGWAPSSHKLDCRETVSPHEKIPTRDLSREQKQPSKLLLPARHTSN